jgi:NADH-quinone oxidoreductase subunit M
MQDLTRREMAILAPLCALMIWIGWHPTPLLERMEPSVRAVIERVEAAGALTQAEATGAPARTTPAPAPAPTAMAGATTAPAAATTAGSASGSAN